VTTTSDTATHEAPATPPSVGVQAMHALRAQRKRNRLGDIEWFDAAYKVYVVGLFGGIGLAWASDLVGDHELSVAQAADVATHGPAVLGLFAVIAFVLGLRGGSQGGPLALEAADVTYVMLAPVPRRAALLKPAVQRLRSAAFTGAIVGASFGQLAGRRLPGTPMAWFWSGALFGGGCALLWVGGALVAHALRIPLAISTIVGVALVSWQVAAVTAGVPGPGNLHGSIALWGWRQRGIDVVALAIDVALVAVGLTLVARTSLDALARRSSLVAQLRFAVTMQDLRTVILLRRQLSYEHTRRRPWIRLRSGAGGHAVWRRGWHSLLRLPTGRLLRMAALAIGAGACQVAVVHGTTPALLGTMILVFVLGLEVLEPLSQEIDQPDRTDSFPVERGDLMLRHLVAPAVALVPFALLAGAAAVVIDAMVTDGERIGAAAAVAGILALPTLLAGAAGGAVSIVRDAPDPVSAKSTEAFMPPEMAGFTTVLSTFVPLVVPLLAGLSVLAVRQALPKGLTSTLAADARVAVGLLLLVALVAAWVRYRDRLRAKFRAFMDEGRTYTSQQRSSR
jgi:hypothetical protein